MATMHKTRCLLAWALLGVAACVDPGIKTPGAQPAAERASTLGELRNAIDTFYEAYYDSDFDRYYEFYAQDVVIIDSTGRARTLEEYKIESEEFANAVGDVVRESVVDLVPAIWLSPAGDSAVAHWIHPFVYRTSDGDESTFIFAESDVWSKIDGEWKVVHIHYQEVAGEN